MRLHVQGHIHFAELHLSVLLASLRYQATCEWRSQIDCILRANLHVLTEILLKEFHWV